MTPTAVGTAAPMNTPVQYLNAGDRNSTFQVNYQIGLQDQLRTSQPFSSTGIKADYSDLDSQSRTSTTVTPGEQPSMDYLSHTSFVPPQTSAPEQQQHNAYHAPYHHHTPLSTQHQANGQFNAWSSPFQSNVFNSVDYTGHSLPQQPLPQQHQVHMLPTNPLPLPQQTHAGHHIHSTRPQAQFETMSLNNGSPQFRNGSLSHPHMEPRHGETNHSLNEYK